MRADGGHYEWRSVAIVSTGFEPLMPVFVDWRETGEAPAASAPRLLSITAEHPEPTALRSAYDAFDVVVPVARGSDEAPGLVVEIESVDGGVVAFRGGAVEKTGGGAN